MNACKRIAGIFCAVLFLLSGAALSACAPRDEGGPDGQERCRLTLTLPAPLELYAPLQGSYPAGERVEARVCAAEGYEVCAYLDADRLWLDLLSDGSGEEFYACNFIMPAHAADLIFTAKEIAEEPAEPSEPIDCRVAFAEADFRNGGMYTFSVIASAEAWQAVSGQFPEGALSYGEDFFTGGGERSQAKALVVIIASRSNMGGYFRSVTMERRGYDIVIDIRLEDGNMTAASDWAVVLEVKKQDIGDGELRLKTNFGYGFNAYL